MTFPEFLISASPAVKWSKIGQMRGSRQVLSCVSVWHRFEKDSQYKSGSCWKNGRCLPRTQGWGVLTAMLHAYHLRRQLKQKVEAAPVSFPCQPSIQGVTCFRFSLAGSESSECWLHSTDPGAVDHTPARSLTTAVHFQESADDEAARLSCGI